VASLLALDEDGRGGVFLMTGSPTGPSPSGPLLETRLYRRQGDGQSAADWPAGGGIGPPAMTHYDYYGGADPDASYRLPSDHRDGVYVGAWQLVLDAPSYEQFNHCSATGQFVEAASRCPAGYEIAARGDGGLYYASFGCCYYVYQIAFIQAAQFPYAPGYYE